MNIAGYKSSEVMPIANELTRGAYDNSDGRVDVSRTKYNYILGRDAPRSAAGIYGKINARIAGIARDKKAEIMTDWIITCPQELVGDPVKVRRFFALAYKYCTDTYSEENVIGGYIHMDEGTPHMHVVTVPVVEAGTSYKSTVRRTIVDDTGKKIKTRENVIKQYDTDRVSHHALHTKDELRRFHADFDVICEREFGSRGMILNGKTKKIGKLALSNKEFKMIKQEEARLQEEAAKIQEREAAIEVALRAAQEAKSVYEELQRTFGADLDRDRRRKAQAAASKISITEEILRKAEEINRKNDGRGNNYSL